MARFWRIGSWLLGAAFVAVIVASWVHPQPEPQVIKAFWPQILALIGSALIGHKSNSSSNDNTAQMNELYKTVLPQIMPLIQANTNLQARQGAYTDPGIAQMFGIDTPQGAAPVQSALAQMAYRLLPTYAKTGLTGPGTGVPSPTPAPTTTPPQRQMPRDRADARMARMV